MKNTCYFFLRRFYKTVRKYPSVSKTLPAYLPVWCWPVVAFLVAMVMGLLGKDPGKYNHLLHSRNYWIPVAGSTIIAFILIFYIHHVIRICDAFFHFYPRYKARRPWLLKWPLAILLPWGLNLLLVKFLFYLFHQDFARSKYLHLHQGVVLALIILMNNIYSKQFFRSVAGKENAYRKWLRKQLIAADIQLKELAAENQQQKEKYQLALKKAREKIDQGIKTDPKVAKISTRNIIFWGEQAGEKVPISEEEIGYIESSDRKRFLKTLRGMVYVIEETLEEAMVKLDNVLFIAINKNYVVNKLLFIELISQKELTKSRDNSAYVYVLKFGNKPMGVLDRRIDKSKTKEFKKHIADRPYLLTYYRNTYAKSLPE